MAALPRDSVAVGRRHSPLQGVYALHKGVNRPRSGVNPSHGLAHPSRRPANPSRKAANPSCKAASPSRRGVNPSHKGVNPSHRPANPSRRGRDRVHGVAGWGVSGVSEIGCQAGGSGGMAAAACHEQRWWRRTAWHNPVWRPGAAQGRASSGFRAPVSAEGLPAAAVRQGEAAPSRRLFNQSGVGVQVPGVVRVRHPVRPAARASGQASPCVFIPIRNFLCHQ